MMSQESRSIAEQARRLYESDLRSVLEQSDRGRFVAIEPTSGEYFVGDTFDAAVNSALDRFPERLTHTIRIGHRTALHLGGVIQ